MRVGPLGLGSHSASSRVARVDCRLWRGLSAGLRGGAGPPCLPCPSWPPVSLAAPCPWLAAPHSVSASMLRATSFLQSSYRAPVCVCVQGLPLLTRMPCFRAQPLTHAGALFPNKVTP